MRTLLFSLSMGLVALTSTGVGYAAGMTAPTHQNGRTTPNKTHRPRHAHRHVHAADRPHAHGRNLH